MFYARGKDGTPIKTNDDEIMVDTDRKRLTIRIINAYPFEVYFTIHEVDLTKLIETFDKVTHLKSYLRLDKFNHPENWVNTDDIWHRLDY